jgi:hypothetical protein
VGLLRSVGIAGAVALAAAGLSACGAEPTDNAGPALSSPRVAMTVSYPGYAPFALITYRDAAGRPCHSLASVTTNGPRVMGRLGSSLADGLAHGGTCVKPNAGDVSVQVRQAGRGPRIVGGIVRAGVTRVVVAGQSVRPRAGGAFLLVQPAGTGALGRDIELEYHAGHHRRLSLRRVAS